MNAQGAINTDPDEIADNAHNCIRKAYYETSDGLYTMINIGELTGDHDLKKMCRDFGEALYNRLNEKHPNWD